jgi:hypothetical protein
MPPFPISNFAFYLATIAVLAFCVFLFWVVGYDFRRLLRYLLKNAKWISLNALLVTVAAFALMLAPPPPAGTPCVETHHVWGPLEMVVSCDSYEFVEGALHPERLSMTRSYRQTRPLWVAIASLLKFAEFPPYVQLLIPGWLPYVVLNFILLVISLMLFRQLLEPGAWTSSLAVVILGTLLVFNDVVKGFFWSAHTQMWNVLVPLISISVALAFLRRPTRSWQFMAAAGALLGIGLLAYGTLIIAVAAAIAAIGLAYWSERDRPPLLITLGKVCVFTAAAAVPSLLWMKILTMTTGSYYHPEFEDCREFVWVYDYWRGGDPQALQHQQLCGPVPHPREFLGLFARHVWNVLWPVLGIVVIAALGIFSSTRLKESIRQRRLILIAAAITLVMCLGFFGLLGFYRNRLAFNVVVPVIVAASVILTSQIERMTKKHAMVMLLLLSVAAALCVMAALFRMGSYI